MRDGTVHRDGERAVIRFERDLPDPPAVVWRAITDRAELKAWFPCDVIVESWTTGASLEFVFTEHAVTLTGTVLAVDEPRRLAYTWGEETLRFELAPTSSGGTRLVLTDELGRSQAARNAAGWEICLERLAGRSPAGGVWRPLFDHYVASFRPGLGPQEGPPLGFEG
jgi:uncharacterized protein YndB with AHSA1/START domain